MTAIDDFLAQKPLAPNSLLAYRYDLEQFREVIGGEIEAGRLALYQTFLADLKPTAQKRKLSAVNQFLYYLYETGQIKQYHKLKLATKPKLQVASSWELRDLTALWEGPRELPGQLLALFMVSLGLQPNELLALKREDINLDFQVITVHRGQERRVLHLPQTLLPYLTDLPAEGPLFAKNGHVYSRQWAFNQLNRYLESVGLGDLTAQKLREHYILQRLASGDHLAVIAKDLGLKSLVSLEKYSTFKG